MTKKKKNPGQVVKVGLRTFNVYKDYENNIITVLENNKEAYHGPSHRYHKWLREQKEILAISRTKSK